MVYHTIRALVASLLIMAGSGPVVAGPVGVDSQIDPGAQAVAQAYFDALQAGNRQALLSLFTGKERTRYEDQLNDPEYSSFLVTRYSHARLETTASGEYSGLPYIDIAIWLNDMEAIRERLILQPASDATGLSYQIAARKELSQ